MNKFALNFKLFALIIGVWISLTSCSNEPTKPDLSASEWEYSEPSIYAVESTPTSVYDTVTGVTLSFPEGGNGNVSISKIKSSPLAPVEGEGVKIEYMGNTPIDLVVDTLGGYEAVVFEYGKFSGCFDDDIGGGERWTEVPESGKNGSEISFMLMMPVELQKTNAGKKYGSNNFWIARLKPGADKVQQRLAASMQMDSYYKQFVAALPASLKSKVESKRKSAYLRERFESGGAYYSGFWMRIFGSGLTYQPTIHLNLPPKPQQIAHEFGHYLIHLTVGDGVQATLEGQGNLTSGHGVLDVNGRYNLLEDLAYFTEYFISGVGAGIYNLTEPYDMLRGQKPDKNDFPSYEGFAAHFLAQLIRTKPQIRDFASGNSVDIPLLKLNYGQVFEIISKGATGINDLRANIESYLGTRADRLPVIAHRVGWRYSVKGKLVDPSGTPVHDAIIKPIKIVDGVTYQGKLKGTCFSRKDGSFTLTAEAFPGKSALQIIQTTGDSTDIPIEIDWNKLTTEMIDLGTLEVKPIRKIKSIDIGIAYTGTFDETYPDTLYTFHSQSTLEGIYKGGSSETTGNTISATTATSQGIYDQVSTIQVTFDDVTNPGKVLGFSINNDGLDTFVNAIIKESAVGQNVPFSVYHQGKIYQFTYWGNISAYLSTLTYISTRSEKFTKPDGSTFSADVIYQLVGYDSQGSISINVEYE